MAHLSIPTRETDKKGFFDIVDIALLESLKMFYFCPYQRGNLLHPYTVPPSELQPQPPHKAEAPPHTTIRTAAHHLTILPINLVCNTIYPPARLLPTIQVGYYV